MSKMNLPVLLVDKVILPYNSIQLDFTSETDKTVIDEAELFHHNKVLLVFKRTNNQDMVDINNLPNIAVTASIMQDTSLINGGRQLNLKCLNRSLVHEYLYQNGTIESIVSNITEDRVEQEIETALVTKLKEELQRFLDMSKSSKNVLESIKDIDNLNILTDKIAYRLNFENDRLLLYLMCYNSLKRMELVLEDIYKLEQLFASEKPSKSTKAVISRPKREFFLKEKIVVDNKERVKNKEEIVKNYTQLASKLEIDSSAREFLLDTVNYYKILSDDAAETFTYHKYLSYVLSLPWTKNEKKLVLSDVKKKLDSSFYGLDEVKGILMENLAVNFETRKGFSLCLVGPSGTGKSALVKVFADSINTKFTHISLDGVNNMSELVGESKTLIGGNAGLIVDSIKKTNVIDPIIVINDIDKVNNGEIVSVLKNIINNEFYDKYLEFKYDLSNIIFIFTASSEEGIPASLKENLEIIHVDKYKDAEKVEIARNCIIPKIALKYDLNIAFKDDVIKAIITDYTSDAGLAELEKNINKIFRKAKANNVLNNKKSKVKIEVKDLDKYLGREVLDVKKK